MAADKPDSSSFPLGNVLAIVLLVAGVVVHQLPLESKRPAVPGAKGSSYENIQDVDARLWQDPLAAVERFNEERAGKTKGQDAGRQPQRIAIEVKPGPGAGREVSLNANFRIAAAEPDHDLSRVWEYIQKQEENGPGVALLGVMVPGGPYTEDAEFRRRTRYAVLAGLEASGYKPDDADKLGFFTYAKGEDAPEVVPFEFFTKHRVTCKIMVLWLDETRFDPSSPLEKLRKQINNIFNIPTKSKSKDPNARLCRSTVRIIGPASSDFLANMINVFKPDQLITDRVNQSTQPEDSQPEDSRPYEFYSPSATASLEGLVDLFFRDLLRHADQPIHDEFDLFRNVKLFRTINTDTQVMEALVAELGLRGVHPGRGNGHILLVSEWDTAYGQRLPAVLPGPRQRRAAMIPRS